MISASAEYLEQESLKTGAIPAIKATLFPYLWPVAMNSDGTFVEMSFAGPDRILADYHGFATGYRISPIISSNVQVANSQAIFNWLMNTPGYEAGLYWKTSNDNVIWSPDWILLTKGGTVTIPIYYKLFFQAIGFRAWAEDSVDDVDDFTAWAVDTAGVEEEEGFADDAEVPGDVRTYLEGLTLTGEYAIFSDIEQAGSLTQEAPKAFDDLVAGSHSGLLLNNRQSVLVDGNITPAPRYSPNKDTFFLAGQDWFGLKLRIEMGWSLGDWFAGEIFDDPFLENRFTDFIKIFEGKVTKWGPVSRGVEAPVTVEVFAKDWIMECLNKRIALPSEDGTPNPLIFGEFLCKGEAISGWSPAPIYRAAYFENDNYNELSRIVAAGGAAYSLVTPGLTGNRAFRAETSGNYQTVYAAITMAAASEIFVTGTIRFTVMPGTPSNLNTTFLQIIDASTLADFSISVDYTGALYANLGGQSKFNILPYIDVPLSFAMWLSTTNPACAALWINGDEVLSYSGNQPGIAPLEFRFGVQTDNASETWKVDFDNIEIRTKYYKDAFQVAGGPFEAIGPVYVDNLFQPDSKTVGSYVQTLARYPALGMVQFTSTDPEFKADGEVLIRVVEHAGGRHALEIIEGLLAAAGVTAYIDATALAAAYAAVPDDYFHARFEGGGEKGQGLKDLASLGVTVADCIKEVCARSLYWLFVDAGKIKIIPYTGIPPTSPVMALGADNLYEATQTIDLDQLNTFVTAIYGWYDRNPSLFYVAGTPAAGGQGRGLDYTWSSPVACERLDVVKAKADNLLKFLSAQERLEPVRLNLAGARLELMETVSVEDSILGDSVKNYFVTRKDVGLDPGSRETSLQLIRFLGE